MPNKKIAKNFPAKPCTVGVIDSSASLRSAMGLVPGSLDYLEIRADAFVDCEDTILHQLPKLKFPLIITVRHFSEGGRNRLTTAARRDLFGKFLPHAAMVDIELRSAKVLADVLQTARKGKIISIVSHHDFRRTPSLKRLRSLARAAKRTGADIFKIAAVTSQPADIATLLAFQHSQKIMPFSVMGMGRFGKVSRLLFAQAGSLLNYGFLDVAQVSGQWPATLLKKRIEELI